MPKIWFIFLMISISGCATKKSPWPRLEGKWHIIEVVPGKKAACIPLKDLQKIKERLLRCEWEDLK